jgi:hypothetical protein
LFANDTLFRSPMTPRDSPEMLFYRLEQCQEIQRVGKLPYTDEQIIATAVRILASANMFPLKEFDTWDATAVQTYPALKTFFQEAYGRRLTAMELRGTTGQAGYTNPTIYNAFETQDEDTDDDTVNTIVTIPQTAAAVTVGSSIGAASAATISANADITAAINQLAANQTAIMSQMAAMSFAAAPPNPHRARPPNPFQVPPIQQLAIPLQQQFPPPGGNNAGRGGRGGRGRGRGRGGRSLTPFADHMRTVGHTPAMPAPLGRGGAQIPQQQTRNPDFSNIYKRYNNWNVCFTCGFDIEDGHTSQTCPFKKANHQTSFVRENAQQFIAAGYDPCTKGMHKTVLPSQRIA